MKPAPCGFLVHFSLPRDEAGEVQLDKCELACYFHFGVQRRTEGLPVHLILSVSLFFFHEKRKKIVSLTESRRIGYVDGVEEKRIGFSV